MPNCGTGGNAVTLYAEFQPRRAEADDQGSHLGASEPSAGSYGESPYDHDRYIPEPIRPLHERSQIYLELLSLLTLEEKAPPKSAAPRALGRDHSREHVPQYSDKLENSAGRAVEQLASRYDLPVCLDSIPGISGGFVKLPVQRDSDPCLRQEQPDWRLQLRLDEPPPKNHYPAGWQRPRKRRTLPLAFHRRHVERQKVL